MPGGTGTAIAFLPDGEIFETTLYAFAALSQRLRDLRLLHHGLAVSLTDERPERPELPEWPARRPAEPDPSLLRRSGSRDLAIGVSCRGSIGIGHRGPGPPGRRIGS
ncbi:hypothetical protein [Streptomyces sp. NPDC091268]|uniref:hypothetical protein n=1 Tax=Streptomyces sp. NPDC091268 TaxID=3365979 RepID=UPI0037FE88EC